MEHPKKRYNQGTCRAVELKGKSGGHVWELSINEGTITPVTDDKGEVVRLENGTIKTTTKWRTLRKRIDVPCRRSGRTYTGITKAKEALADWRNELVQLAEEERQREIEEEIEAEKQGQFSYDNMLVPVFLDSYFEELRAKNREKSTISGYISSTAKLRRYFADKSLGELTKADLAAFDKTCNDQGLKETTRAKGLRVLKQAIKLHADKLSVDPFRGFEMPSQQSSDPNPLNKDSKDLLIQRLEESEPDSFMTAVELALRTGMRQGEICGLRWRDIDDATNKIHVCNAIGRYDGNSRFYPKGPKSNPRKRKSADRWIPISPKIRAMLDRRFEFMVDEYLEENLEATLEEARQAIRRMYVVGDVNGGYANPTVMGRTWRGYSQFLRGTKGRRPSFHDLRHSYASYALNAGVPVPTVSKILGHSDSSITLRIYTDSIDGSDLAAQEIMDGVFSLAGSPEIPDTLQAIVAALLFGEDAGLAARDNDSELYPESGCIVHLSDEAIRLLREAQTIAEAIEPQRGRDTRHYDLTRAAS